MTKFLDSRRQWLFGGIGSISIGVLASLLYGSAQTSLLNVHHPSEFMQLEAAYKKGEEQ
jgi:hypothetical protein